jgi:lysozyme family protein
MASGNFDACLVHTLKWEGGYSNHPDDPGGATMKGVTQAVYDAYRKRRGWRGRQSVSRITDAEVRDIYRTNYWDACGCEGLEPGLDLAVFDAAVNSGPARARAWLAEARTVNGYCDRRLAFVQSLGRLWRVFGVGWSRRVTAIRAAANAMAGGATTEAEDTTASLHAGMRGEAVRRLQTRLRALGYPCGLVDGIFGEQTYRAVILFQEDHDLGGERGVWLPEFNARLETATAMLPKRKAATAKTVEAAGDTPIRRMNLLQRVFAWLFGASAAAQVFQGTDVLGSLNAARGVLDPALSLWAWAGENRWLLVAAGCIGIIALVRAIRAEHVSAFQHFDYQGAFPKGETHA